MRFFFFSGIRQTLSTGKQETQATDITNAFKANQTAHVGHVFKMKYSSECLSHFYDGLYTI